MENIEDHHNVNLMEEEDSDKDGMNSSKSSKLQEEENVNCDSDSVATTKVENIKRTRIGLVSDMLEVGFCYYLLHFSHIGLARSAPGRHRNSDVNPKLFPDTFF